MLLLYYMQFWSEWCDLNTRSLGPEPSALPVELHPETTAYIIHICQGNVNNYNKKSREFSLGSECQKSRQPSKRKIYDGMRLFFLIQILNYALNFQYLSKLLGRKAFWLTTQLALYRTTVRRRVRVARLDDLFDLCQSVKNKFFDRLNTVRHTPYSIVFRRFS